MSARPLEIFSPGMVSSVGLSSAATCAAVRAGLTNPTPTRFAAPEGRYFMAHAAPLEGAWRGIRKLAQMAAMSMQEALSGIPVNQWSTIPVILCVAERGRAGRLDGLDEELLAHIEDLLEVRFSPESLIVPQGRVSAAVALLHAQRFLYEKSAPMVLLAAVDSLLTWPTLRSLAYQDRLLTPTNSNGFIPGEGASAVLVRRPDGNAPLICRGLGFATETASLESEQPLRGDGMTSAIKKSLAEADCELHHLDFRIAAVSGEQYFFKEAALALGRVLRERKETFDLWNPADCIGETGANIGVACLAIAYAASRLKYAPGRGVLVHASADSGECAAIVAFGGA